MNEWDQMVARQVEADGVRMASGQHIDTLPEGAGCPAMPWADRAAEIYEQEVQKARIAAYRENADRDPWVDRRDNDR